uniref:FeoA domain-containing protein n=1 Tax=Steinernema glaseri TaxID=37863 RepID=A0A1I8A0E4_9BILA
MTFRSAYRSQKQFLYSITVVRVGPYRMAHLAALGFNPTDVRNIVVPNEICLMIKVLLSASNAFASFCVKHRKSGRICFLRSLSLGERP